MESFGTFAKGKTLFSQDKGVYMCVCVIMYIYAK